MLLLKKHLVHLVRIGKKRQTIRLWSKPLLRPGQISYTPGLGKMKITAVDILPTLAALTEKDALLDGFDSLPALLAEIKKIYRATPANKTIYRIKFTWPIDPAGHSLILTPAKTAPHKNPPNNPTPSRHPAPAATFARSASMTTHQRQTLRTYILKKTPGHS